MTTNEIRELVVRELAAIAPDADLRSLDPAADVRDALDLDSMDLLRLATALAERTSVEIPESAYASIATLDGCVDYLERALNARKPTTHAR